jgi:hypothetical protein
MKSKLYMVNDVEKAMHPEVRYPTITSLVLYINAKLLRSH